MDQLVKRNVIKKNKTIIDFGKKHTKLLAVHYEKGRMAIQRNAALDTISCYHENGQLDYNEIVRMINAALADNHIARKHEISLSLPSAMVTQKIVTAKNIKTRDLDKYIRKEYSSLGRANTVSHEMDWGYLGSREINGETVHYCMIAAVSKAHLIPLLKEFEKRKLKVTAVSSPVYNLIRLSDLFVNDYNYPNKMLLDFGSTQTRLVIVSGAVAVYARTIEIGFETFVHSLFQAFGGFVGIPDIIDILVNPDPYLGGLHDKDAFYAVVENLQTDIQNELIRIMRMCEEDEIPITKIICCSPILDNTIETFGTQGIEIEHFRLNPEETAAGKNYIVLPGEAGLNTEYSSALGLAVSTLQ